MNQNDVESINLDEIKLSDKNKKTKSFRKIILLSIGSLVATLLMIDIPSGIIGGLGIISFSSLLLIPLLFAFPIIIKTPKLLLIPSILLPLFIFIITIAFFSPSDCLSLIIVFCVVSIIAAIIGIATGGLIKLIGSKRIFVRIIATAIGTITLIAVMVSIANYMSNPLLKPNEQIKESILEITPIGMSKEQVIALIETNEQWHKNKYKDLYENMYDGKYQYFDYGYAIKNGIFLIRYHGGQYDDTEMIGKEAIEAPIGTYTNFAYGFPFDTTVYVYWAFDENSNLVDVAITKDTDGF